MENINKNNNRYKDLRNHTGILAETCGCSYYYVRQVLNGRRTPKTERAVLASKVLQKADELLAAIEKLKTN